MKAVFTSIMALFGGIVGFSIGMFLNMPGEIAIVGILAVGMGCIVHAIESK